MRPLLIDELRCATLAAACDRLDEEHPRLPEWKRRRAEAYSRLAAACDLALANARSGQRQQRSPG